MTLWSDVVAAGLLGTERRPPDFSSASGPLGEALAQAAARPDEEALLAGAAVLVSYRRAGAVPAPAGEPGPIAPDDPRPVAPAAAGRRLGELIEERRWALVAEWLAACVAGGRRPPPELAPALLATADAHVERLLGAALGERGAWLAERLGLERTVVAVAADAEERWEAAGARERALLLRLVRERDAERGRALLERVWAGEPPDQRAGLLGAMAAGLSDADEPFLEAALDDRRGAVRTAAAELLARLPRSRLAARMAARTEPLLALRKRRLVVTLPAEHGKAMARDGIAARPPRGVGERAWWLRQMLAATPLETWPRRLGAPPDELAALRGDDAPLVQEAWAEAAARQGDAAWARALLAAGAVAPAAIAPLIAVLPPPEREAYAIAALESGRHADAAGALPALTDAWSLRLTAAFLAAYADELEREEGPLLRVLELAALRADPEAAGAAERLLDPAALSQRARRLAQLADTLHLRRAMLHELR